MRGVKRVAGPISERKKFPLTKFILTKVGAVINTSSYDAAVVWSIMTLARAGMFRLGELLPIYPIPPLHVNDIVVSSNCVIVYLKFQKNDAFGKGCQVKIPKMGDYTCAFSAFKYLKNLRASYPLLSSSPYAFVWSNGAAVSKNHFLSRFKALLRAINIDASKFAGHSFRRGGCQDLAREGYSHADIMVAGRWKSTSFLRYL